MNDTRYGDSYHHYKEGKYTLNYRNGFIPEQTRYYRDLDRLNKEVQELCREGFEYYPDNRSAFKSFYVLDKNGRLLPPKD